MLERAVTYKNNGQINIILNGQKQVLTNAEAEAEYQAALQKRSKARHFEGNRKRDERTGWDGGNET